MIHSEFLGDPQATADLLDEACREIETRVRAGARGPSLADKPVRLYVAGVCVSPNPLVVDTAGGVQVGSEEWLGRRMLEVDEEGDPYEALARSALNSYIFTQPAQERARLIVEDVKRSRADGFIYMYNWGCNYESAPAALICDIVKRDLGIPTAIIEMAELVKLESTEYSQNRTESFIELIRLRAP